MRSRLILLLTLALSLLLAACNQAGSILPNATITSVTPRQVSPGTEIIITGQGFYQHAGGDGIRVEICGITIPGSLIEATTQTIVLPPAGRISVETGSQVTVILPAEGFQAGANQLRIIRPDGGSSILEASITCLLPEPDPELPDPELPDPELPDPELPDPEAPDNEPPTAVFTIGFPGDDRLTISLDASDSEDPDGSITSYTWDFGDGNTATGVKTTHTYANHTTYTITLTTTDNQGATGQASRNITTFSGVLINARSTPEDLGALILVPGPDDFDAYITGSGIIVAPDPGKYNLIAMPFWRETCHAFEYWHANPQTHTISLNEGEEHSAHRARACAAAKYSKRVTAVGAGCSETTDQQETAVDRFTSEQYHTPGTGVEHIL